MDVRSIKKEITVGGVKIGGGNPVSVQSMTNTRTEDVDATVEQILRLENAGCEIVRASVYNNDCAKAFKKIKERIHIPLVADIHFDYRLAIAAAENGADKLRINPGNIGAEERVAAVARCAAEHHIPIRVGVNLGSLDPDIEKQYGRGSDALVQSALRNIRMLERHGFYDIAVSVKASDVRIMTESCEKLSVCCEYPQHLGVTESGGGIAATVKNSVGIGSLLLRGIGDTIRVTVTGDPVQEVPIAREILRSTGLYRGGAEIISCPTCGRTRIDIPAIAEEVKRRTAHITKPVRIAVMGCVVNGPGEAKDSDIGIAGGSGKGVVFVKGKQVATVDEDRLIDELMRQLDALLENTEE